MNDNHYDNCFLLLGKTGSGKSTLAKILSGDSSIIINDSLESQSKEAKCYKCKIADFKFAIIDTPGYDDSNGNDKNNFKHIKNFLTSDKFKIKGIFFLFSFQERRFGENHINGLKEIVKLIPLDNFWDYITIIFTFYFLDDEDELRERREILLKSFEEVFTPLISDSEKNQQIKGIEFSKIKKEFVNLKIKKTTKEMLGQIISIIKGNQNLDPLFHRVNIEEKFDEILVMKEGCDSGDLYKVTYKTINYYNQKGEVIKSLSKYVNKDKIKTINKVNFTGGIKALGSIIVNGLKIIGISGIMILSAPLMIQEGFANLIFETSDDINNDYSYLTNKNFKEKKTTKELIIDENF